MLSIEKNPPAKFYAVFAFSAILLFFTVFVLCPLPASAADQTELYIDKGDIIIGQTSVFGYDKDGDPVIIFNLSGYIIKQTNPLVSTVHNITVNSGNINLTLSGVNIQAINSEKGTLRNALNIASGASVTLTLEGGNTLSSTDTYGAKNGTAAVHVPNGAELNIKTGGILYARGGSEHGAAIGGNEHESCGTVEINGGTVEASSGYYAAAIGGGFGGGSGTITINDGSVDAIGHGSSGIGMGYEYTGSTPGSITITGGYVAARDEASGVGIGSGVKASVGCPVTITGGTVDARGWAGIGGHNGAAGSLTITGGSVHASSGVASALTVQATNGANNVYQTLLTLPVSGNVSALSYKQGGSSVTYPAHDVQTDSNKQLFLYLPLYEDGDTIVTVTLSGGTVYTYHGSVNNTENILKMDQAALSITNLDSMYDFLLSSLISPSTNGGSGSGEVTYLYEGTYSTVYSGNAVPSAIGTYKLTATKAADDVYHAASVTKEFKLVGDIEFPVVCTISVQSLFDYTGLAITPTVNVTFNEKMLSLGTDFKLEYSDNTNPGSATIKIIGIDTGTGLYTGTVTKTFTIQKVYLHPGLTAGPASSAEKGKTVKLTATITDLAAVPGTATFKCGTNVIASGVAFTGSMFDWTATTDWSGSPVGDYTISVEYVPNGDADNLQANTPGTLNYSITKLLQTAFDFSEGTMSKMYGDIAFSVGATGGQSTGTVIYSSGDESIATVNETTGQVTILKAGTVIITALKAGDGDYLPTTATVTILINKASQSGFGFSDSTIAKTYGSGAFSVGATGGQSIGAVTYSSGDTSIATVDGVTGAVTMLKAGDVTITAHKAADDCYNPATAAITINISKAFQSGFGFSSGTIDKPYGGDAFAITAAGGQSTGAVTYASSDTSIATVDETTGLVTMLKTGTVNITAKKASDGNYFEASATMIIHINKANQTDFKFTEETITRNFGDSAFSVEATGGQSSGAVTYSSGDTSIATVDETTGLVTILKAGTVTIIAEKAGDDNYNPTAATAKIVINDPFVPTGEIKTTTNTWRSYLNSITFGLFFNETVDVTIAASDEGSGVKSIQYYESAQALTPDEAKAVTDWRDYTGALQVTPVHAKRFIIYAKVTDMSGNVAYISSDGMAFDTQAPLIRTDYTKDAVSMNVSVTETDSGIDNVSYTVNGGATITASPNAQGVFVISPLPEGRYNVVINATDKLGNKSSLTINVVSVYTVTFMPDDAGDALKTESVEYGSAATAPHHPSRTGFSFRNWDKDYSRITEDTVVTARWDVGGIMITPYSGTYDGEAHKAVTVSGTLTEDIMTYSTDGTSFSADCPMYTDAGSYAVYIKVERSGYAAFESRLNTAEIRRKTITEEMIADIPSVEYTGQPLTPLPEVTCGLMLLEKDTDYTVTYTDNTDIGQACACIKGMGNFTGDVTKKFEIHSKSVSVDNGAIDTDANATTGSANADKEAIDAAANVTTGGSNADGDISVAIIITILLIIILIVAVILFIILKRKKYKEN